MEQRVGLLGLVTRRGSQLEDLDAVQRPSVRIGRASELVGGHGEDDVETALALTAPGDEELEGECGLTASGLAVDEIQAVCGQSAAKDGVQAGNAGSQAEVRRRRPLGLDGVGHEENA